MPTLAKYLVTADIPSVGIVQQSHLFDTLDEAMDLAKMIGLVFGDGIIDIDRHAVAVEFHHVSGAVLPLMDVTTKYVVNCRRDDATIRIDVVPSFPRPMSCQLN